MEGANVYNDAEGCRVDPQWAATAMATATATATAMAMATAVAMATATAVAMATAWTAMTLCVYSHISGAAASDSKRPNGADQGQGEGRKGGWKVRTLYDW